MGELNDVDRDACEAVAESDSGVGERVGGWFQQWAALGWLARVHF